jgi:hypothetical protein
MGNAILFAMDYGVAGSLSRGAGQATVESQKFVSAAPFASYGLPAKLVAGTGIEPMSATGDGAKIYGFLVRPYPITSPNASDPLGTSTPPTSGVANVMRRGYMSVKCNAGTPAQNGQVYVRVANGAAGTPVGGVEAASVAGTTEAVTGAFFMGSADADGNVEIAFNI